MIKRIYLDHAATTPVDPHVKEKMLPYFSDIFGNPSSLHEDGRAAHHALRTAREQVATLLHARPEEIIFTGSGTESDNMAVFGVAHAYAHKGKHIITTQFEHKAILEPAKLLEKEGFRVTYLPVQKNGLVRLRDIESALTPETILVSIMAAQNEIGTIQPIAKISKLIRTFREGRAYPLFHTDACQAAGAIDLDVEKLGVDLMTVNGSKIYGPKGIGCLYDREGVALSPRIVGGGQEYGKRGGTENLAFIIGFAEALRLAQGLRLKETARLTLLRDHLIRELLMLPKTKLNGHAKDRLPNNVNISFYGVEGESLLLLLDAHGISASTASACSAHDLAPSHVLKAIGLPDEWAHGSIRFTLGRHTKKSDIDHVLKIVPTLVERLRNMSPIQ